MFQNHLLIQETRYGTRTKAIVWSVQKMHQWNSSLSAVVLPMYGEFGWLVMTHIRFVHSLDATKKIVCCEKAHGCLFPSATGLFYEWENPIAEDDRCGHSGWRHGERCGPYDIQLVNRFASLYPGHVVVRPSNFDCTWHLSDAVKFKPVVSPALSSVDVALGVRKRNFVNDKNWQHWPQLVSALKQSGLTVGLVGGRSTSFNDLPADARAWDHPEGETAGSIDLMSRCKLYVGSDTGVSHLAALMDTPMIVFRRNLPGNPDWCGVMERSNKRFFRKLDDAAWFNPAEVINGVFQSLAEVGEDSRDFAVSQSAGR